MVVGAVGYREGVDPEEAHRRRYRSPEEAVTVMVASKIDQIREHWYKPELSNPEIAERVGLSVKRLAALAAQHQLPNRQSIRTRSKRGPYGPRSVGSK